MATNLEAKQALARKLDINYADIANNDLFTDTDLQEYINTACRLAWDYAPWDFKEHAETATLNSTNVANGYIPYPENIAPSSIELLQVSGVTHDKREYKAFKRWFENYPTSQDKIWAEFKRLIFLNTNLISVGSVIDIYGTKTLASLSADADLLPFSPDADNDEYSGNDAIIRLAYAEALSSDKLQNTTQAEVERKGAYGTLSVLSEALKMGRSSEQSKNRPMFDVPDFFRGRTGRGDSPTGTFSV